MVDKYLHLFIFVYLFCLFLRRVTCCVSLVVLALMLSGTSRSRLIGRAYGMKC